MAGLLDLPAELRNIVYDHVLINTYPGTFNISQRRRLNHLALSQVNRLLRQESLSALYGTKILSLPIWAVSDRELWRWLEVVGPATYGCIRTVRLEGYFDDLHRGQKETILVDFKNFEKPVLYESVHRDGHLTRKQHDRWNRVLRVMNTVSRRPDGVPIVEAKHLSSLYQHFRGWEGDVRAIKLERYPIPKRKFVPVPDKQDLTLVVSKWVPPPPPVPLALSTVIDRNEQRERSAKRGRYPRWNELLDPTHSVLERLDGLETYDFDAVNEFDAGPLDESDPEALNEGDPDTLDEPDRGSLNELDLECERSMAYGQDLWY